MKATVTNLLHFLKKSVQLSIPIYQRNYSWAEEQCKQLWNDILRAGENENIQTHFIGSIVYIEKSLSNITNQEPLLVIDGQQRLTTTSIIIAALESYFIEHNVSEFNGFSAKKLRNYYLINPDEEGDKQFKLLLSKKDKETWLSHLQRISYPADYSLIIEKNYTFFKNRIIKNKEKLVQICQGLAKLTIVEIALARDQDNPQLIFESMNSTGLALSQSDLIRNYILMGLTPQEQENLYTNYWRKMEKNFEQFSDNGVFDEFMRHYLICKTGDIPNIGRVYHEFKYFTQKYFTHNIDELVKDLYDYAENYCEIKLGKIENKTLQSVFKDLEELKAEVTYPLLLTLYRDYKNNILSLADLCESVRLIESYIFRRAICEMPTNSLNKTFANLTNNINKSDYLNNLVAQILLMENYRRYPTDKEFMNNIQIKNVYNFNKRKYLLYKLENYKNREPISKDSEPTIEHIMPQNKALNLEWQNELGSDWKNIHSLYLHRLGNLTLTGYNSKYSDKPFQYKKEEVVDDEGRKVGLAYSKFNLNVDFKDVTQWNKEQIEKRGCRLAELALKIWKRPEVSDEVLKKYKDQQASKMYCIQDHPYLLNSMHFLYQTLKKEIMALDNDITEQFLKLYVAYKIDNNFVDIVPQVKQLRLILNMKFADLYDPNKLCRNVSNIGKWGNGEVEVIFSRLEELPEIMKLIKQSFDYQFAKITE